MSSQKEAKERYPNPERRYPGTGPDTAALDTEIVRLAPSRVTVLIVGRATSFQALVARALHDRSPRAQGPFVTIDCATIHPTVIETVFFGGPSYLPDVRGLVHDAERGTLFVSAIHTMPLALQPRFLGYLDDDRRARVVASTAVDLAIHVESGHFRRDLGERLELVRVVLAPTP